MFLAVVLRLVRRLLVLLKIDEQGTNQPTTTTQEQHPCSQNEEQVYLDVVDSTVGNMPSACLTPYTIRRIKIVDGHAIPCIIERIICLLSISSLPQPATNQPTNQPTPAYDNFIDLSLCKRPMTAMSTGTRFSRSTNTYMDVSHQICGTGLCMLNPYERRFYYFCGLVLDSHRMHPWHTSFPFVGVVFEMDGSCRVAF